MRIGDGGECSQQSPLDPGLPTLYRNQLMEKTHKMSNEFIPSFDSMLQQTDQDLNFSDVLINQQNKSCHTSYQVCRSQNGFVTQRTSPWIPLANNCHLPTEQNTLSCSSEVLNENFILENDCKYQLSSENNECQKALQDLENHRSLNLDDCTGMLPMTQNSTHKDDTSSLHCAELFNQCNCSKIHSSEVFNTSMSNGVVLEWRRNISDHYGGYCTGVRQRVICNSKSPQCVSGQDVERDKSVVEQNISVVERDKSVVEQDISCGIIEQNNNVGELTCKSKLACDKTASVIDVTVRSDIQSKENSTKQENCDFTVQTPVGTKNEDVPIINSVPKPSNKDGIENCGVPTSPNGCCRGQRDRRSREGSLCPRFETNCTNGSFRYSFWTIPDPRNQKLTWNKPPLTVLVVKKLFDDGALSAFLSLVLWLIKTKNMVVFCESSVLDDSIMLMDEKFKEIQNKLQIFNGEKDDLTNKVDFIICLGGDGTLLYASSLFQSSVPPVMAFNLGSLGFLTPFNFNNFKDQVACVLEGNASLLLRYRLKCIVSKRDASSPTKGPIHSRIGARILVFNEVVIDRGQSSYLTNLDLYVEGRLVTTAQGDGIIISTPTGSTAYAMAAGASMVHPSVPAIVITPICPHSLSFRPIVVPAGVEIKVSVAPDSRNPASASFDGRDRQEITQGDSVIITTAQYPVPSVCFKDQMDDWFDSLAECLHWNVRKQQKPLASTPSVTSLDSIDLSN